MLLMPDRRWLLVSGNEQQTGRDGSERQRYTETTQLLDASSGNKVTGFELLLGGNSLMVADNKGGISQWFLVRDDQQRLASDQDP